MIKRVIILLFFIVYFSFSGRCGDVCSDLRGDLYVDLNILKVDSTKSDTTKKEAAIYGWMHIGNVYVSAPRRRGIYRDGSRLERIIAKVYPIAQDAKRTLKGMERELSQLKTKKEQKKYIESIEKELKKKYGPVLMRMTTSEGIVLLKLIDRETGDTSYQLVKEFRGGFSAFFWQNIARLFSVNLKSTYDAEGEDSVIEYYIQKYELEKGYR